MDDHQGEYLIFKYGNDFYRLADSDKFNLKAINRADVKKAGACCFVHAFLRRLYAFLHRKMANHFE